KCDTAKGREARRRTHGRGDLGRHGVGRFIAGQRHLTHNHPRVLRLKHGTVQQHGPAQDAEEKPNASPFAHTLSLSCSRCYIFYIAPTAAVYGSSRCCPRVPKEPVQHAYHPTFTAVGQISSRAPNDNTLYYR